MSFCRKTKSALFTGSEDTTIKRWSLPWDRCPPAADDASVEAAPRAAVTFSQVAHRKDINSLDVAPNDRLLASASQDRSVKLWDAATGNERLVLKGHKRGVWCVKFSPSDQIVASASGDATIRLWNAASGACLRTMEGHTNSVLKLAFVSGGTQIVSSSSDGVVKIWTLKSGECAGTLDAHESKTWALDVNASDSHMVTGGADGSIVIWRDDTTEKDDKARKEQEDKVCAAPPPFFFLPVPFSSALRLTFLSLYTLCRCCCHQLREDQELNNLIQSEEYAEAFRRAVSKNRVGWLVWDLLFACNSDAHTQTHAHTHTYIHIHIHTHTHSLTHSLLHTHTLLHSFTHLPDATREQPRTLLTLMRHLRDRGEMVRACFLFAPFVTHACTLLLISHFSFLISHFFACGVRRFATTG